MPDFEFSNDFMTATFISSDQWIEPLGECRRRSVTALQLDCKVLSAMFRSELCTRHMCPSYIGLFSGNPCHGYPFTRYIKHKTSCDIPSRYSVESSILGLTN